MAKCNDKVFWDWETGVQQYSATCSKEQGHAGLHEFSATSTNKKPYRILWEDAVTVGVRVKRPKPSRVASEEARAS